MVLAQAPVIPGGSHLAYWDSDKAGAMVDTRALEISNHWGPVDAQAELPAERLSELFGTVATYVTPSAQQVMLVVCFVMAAIPKLLPAIARNCIVKGVAQEEASCRQLQSWMFHGVTMKVVSPPMPMDALWLLRGIQRGWYLMQLETSHAAGANLQLQWSPEHHSQEIVSL